jgi:acyl carrier protein
MLPIQIKMDILEKKVISVIRENTVDGCEIRLDNKLEDLGIDSLEKIMIINSIEDEYAIEIGDESIKTLKTVSDIVFKLREKLAMAG